MSFETDVASAILGRVGQVEVPELYQANAKFGGTLQSVFVPGAYGRQSHQYGDKAWFSSIEPTALDKQPISGKYGGNVQSVRAPALSCSPSLLPQDLYN